MTLKITATVRTSCVQKALRAVTHTLQELAMDVHFLRLADPRCKGEGLSCPYVHLKPGPEGTYLFSTKLSSVPQLFRVQMVGSEQGTVLELSSDAVNGATLGLQVIAQALLPFLLDEQSGVTYQEREDVLVALSPAYFALNKVWPKKIQDIAHLPV